MRSIGPATAQFLEAVPKSESRLRHTLEDFYLRTKDIQSPTHTQKAWSELSTIISRYIPNAQEPWHFKAVKILSGEIHLRKSEKC